ncbi:MAG TPA: endonuclease/exonuclease/phosphatase family protein [Actinomycetota bacterium]|nr:endonuclease/exonuclease/phosphatase family protein [Actinomycetota bacterium]
MRVATYNVHHCEGADRRLDVQRVASVIARLRADVVALQELDVALDRTSGVDQPAELARLTGLTVEFHPVLARDRGHYGIALAAPGPLRSEKVDLPRLGEEEPRAAVVGRWDGVTFVGTHLSRSPAARAAQMEALAALVAEVDPPVVLLGDLNERRGGLAPLFAAGLSDGPRGRPRLLRGRIDHILVGRGLTVTSTSTFRSRASDHPALTADLERVE